MLKRRNNYLNHLVLTHKKMFSDEKAHFTNPFAIDKKIKEQPIQAESQHQYSALINSFIDM